MNENKKIFNFSKLDIKWKKEYNEDQVSINIVFNFQNIIWRVKKAKENTMLIIKLRYYFIQL